MPKLIYLTLASLDGYIEDEQGGFDWAAPGDDVHAFVNELMRPVGTYFYGRRMYETMVWWETMDEGEPVHRDFARIWRAADKVVFSHKLERIASERTRIEREFSPGVVRRTLADSGRDGGIGGAEIAAAAFAEGLITEYHTFLAPFVAGGGKPALPRSMPIRLELRDERRFESGMAYLRYDVVGTAHDR